MHIDIIVGLIENHGNIYCESFAFWYFTASLRSRSAFSHRLQFFASSAFRAVSENVDDVKIRDYTKCGAEAKVKIPKGETFTVWHRFYKKYKIR